MADLEDQLSDPQNQNRSDLEVFRVPPKELLEKYSKSDKDLDLEPEEPVNLAPKPMQPQDFGTPKSVFPSKPVPNPPPQMPAQPIVPEPKPAPISPKPITAAIQTRETEKEIDEIAEKETGPIAPPVQPSQKKSKTGLIILILALVLIILSPVVLLALEWMGIYSVGLSKYFGAPPAQLIWSKASFPVTTFSSNFSGEIILPSQGKIDTFLKENNFQDLDEVKFSGTVSRDGEKLMGNFSWQNETAIPFILDQGVLYLQRPDGRWYKTTLGTFSLDNIFQTLGSLFGDASFFKRIRAQEPGYYWYSITKSNVFDLSRYLSTSSFNMNLALDPKTKALSKYWIDSQLTDDTKIILRLNDITSNATPTENLDFELTGASESKEQFGRLVAFLDKIIGGEFAIQETSTQPTNEINTRDAQRKEDLKVLGQTLAAYYQEKGNYPQYSPKIKIDEAETTLGQALTDYLPEGKTWTFTDPKYPDFWYFYVSNGENYALSARLENTSDPEAQLAEDKYIYYILSSTAYNPLK